MTTSKTKKDMRLLASVFSVSMLALLLLGSCKKTEDTTDYTQIDKKIIQDYIKKNSLKADSTASGLYYVIEKLGTGKHPNKYSDVRVKYKGYFTNDDVFENPSTAASFNLSQVIAGWTEGIQLFKEGGSGTLLIPSALAYGSRATGSVPANSVLIFDIILYEVK